MSILVTCPCGKRLQVKAEHGGRKVKCPGCGKALIVPAHQAAARTGIPSEPPPRTSAATQRPRARQQRPRDRQQRQVWYRRFPWLLSLASCAVLVLLILGVPGLRRVVFHGLDTGIEQGAPNGGSANGDSAIGGSLEELASLESSEPGYDVLPPAAAKQPGRTLPKMLLVGRHKDMFPTLEKAVAAAIAGDIIEIRTQIPLVEAGGQLRLKDRIPDRPLTIRAGKGYQPVLRGRTGAAMLIMANVDVKVVGIHCVGGLFVGSKNGNVMLERCSFTACQAVDLGNSTGQVRKVVLDQCLFRQHEGAAVSYSGSSIAIDCRESAFAGFLYAFRTSLGEGQTVRVRQTTFIGTTILRIDCGEQFPKAPLGFRMERSLFSAPWRNPMLVHLGAPLRFQANLADSQEALRRVFQEFKAGDNFGRRWDSWACLVNGLDVKESFPEVPQVIPNLGFGARIGLATQLIHGGNHAGYALAMASVLPEDLVPTAIGALGERMQQGMRYGPDLTRLPVPPAKTLESYQADRIGSQ